MSWVHPDLGEVSPLTNCGVDQGPGKNLPELGRETDLSEQAQRAQRPMASRGPRWNFRLASLRGSAASGWLSIKGFHKGFP